MQSEMVSGFNTNIWKTKKIGFRPNCGPGAGASWTYGALLVVL